MAKNLEAAQRLAARRSQRARLLPALRRRLAGRRRDGEDGALARPGVETDRMVEHPAEALDDREAEAETPGHAGALIEPLELLEHRLLLIRRDAEPGVPDFDAQSRRPPCRQPTSTRPFERILERVRDEVLQADGA